MIGSHLRYIPHSPCQKNHLVQILGYATSLKIVGLSPDEVIEVFFPAVYITLEASSMDRGFTQHLTKLNNRRSSSG
jgi:hypothetical protein